MRYPFIKQQQGHFSVVALCRAMQVSVSGYYAWCKRPISPRQQQNLRLLEQIQAVHQQSKQTYGSPRIYQELKEQGVAGSQNRIARLMRQHAISAQPVKRFVLTTKADPALSVAHNVLARQFEAQTPNARWTADITYLWTHEGWLYLAVLLDLFSRRIVGWAMSATLERSLVLCALDMALSARQPQAGLLCHSDRGSQYASGDYQKALSEAGIVCSMSRKGNCYDNAPTESFFASLKRELVHRTRFATREAARSGVFEWIEVWYNRRRRHSSLGYLSPEAFERQYQQQQKPMAA
jgi:putative transposase